MAKKILVISTTPRKNGNSDILADAFTEGARAAGHDAEKICLRDKTIHFCRGCLACQATNRCVIQDDAESIIQKMKHADVIAFATPIYYYAVSGQMKTLLDRSNPLYASDFAFREVFLLAAAADTAETAMDGAVKDLAGWASCFDGVRLAGVIKGLEADAAGSIEGSKAVEEAYAMGKSVV